MSEAWPIAEFDSIRRLRVMAAALPGTSVVEAVIPAPFETVWAVASDLENELPRFILDVRSVRIESRQGDRLGALIRGHSRLRAHFDVVLRPGWCWMESRFVIGAMAATPTPAGTRFALLGGLRLPRALQAPATVLAQPLERAMMRRFDARVRLRLPAGAQPA